jgi:hypothetical protein
MALCSCCHFRPSSAKALASRASAILWPVGYDLQPELEFQETENHARDVQGRLASEGIRSGRSGLEAKLFFDPFGRNRIDGLKGDHEGSPSVRFRGMGIHHANQCRGRVAGGLA